MTKRVSEMTPEEHQIHLQKRREYRNKNREHINELARNWVKKHQELKDESYLKYRHYISEYQKRNKDKVNEANRKSRRKRGPEYQREYMRKYRAENRNNINQKERYYDKYLRPKRRSKLNDE